MPQSVSKTNFMAARESDDTLRGVEYELPLWEPVVAATMRTFWQWSQFFYIQLQVLDTFHFLVAGKDSFLKPYNRYPEWHILLGAAYTLSQAWFTPKQCPQFLQ